MKLQAYILLLALTLASIVTFGQVTINSVSFSPSPNDCSPTTATIGGQQMCANYAYRGSH